MKRNRFLAFFVMILDSFDNGIFADKSRKIGGKGSF